MGTIAFNTICLQQNMGHGNARRKSLEYCKNELVALMDADDISAKNRFAIQISHFIKNPLLSICGGQITEFIDTPSNIIDKREVPIIHDDIKQYMKCRCPMNQMSVMFRKKDVQKSGGYKDWYCNEDYYLWIRMMKSGCLFENTPESLVNVLVGYDMAGRRGGMKYFRSEAKLQTYMLKEKIISPLRWLYNVGIRFGGEVILTDKLREKVFSLFRSKVDIFDTKRISCERNFDAEAAENMKSSSEIELIDTNDEYPPFSVAMCVYGKDNPEWFDVALHSVIDQTVQPDEIVLVVDGPIPETIQRVIDKYVNICSGGQKLMID